MNEEAKEFILTQMDHMSEERFDKEAFGRSESFATIVENHECMMAHPDEGSPEAIAYWQAAGLTKELHNACTDKLSDKWASYLPNEIAAGESKGKTYPLLFVLHGAGNPIYLAECYGYTKIAAREKLIVIIPEDETAESLDVLFEYAREHYPVDWTRVYMTGYSLGGYMTSRYAIRHPERLAAVGVGGMLFANGHAPAQEQGGKLWPGEELTDGLVQNAAKYHVPACICMGEYEVLGLLPVTHDELANRWVEHITQEDMQRSNMKDEKTPARAERLDLSGHNKIASINNWRIINGASPVDEQRVRDEAAETANIVVEKIGFPFERTSVITCEQRSYYVGDSVSEDGEVRLRVIGASKFPHWISQAQAELTWAFISQFSLDPATGSSRKAEEK